MILDTTYDGEPLVSAEDASSMTKEDIINEAAHSQYELGAKLTNILTSDLPAPPYVEKLLLTPTDVIYLNKGKGLYGVPGIFRNRSDNYTQEQQDKWMAPNKDSMKQVWSLDTKIRDVRNDAISWYPMIQLFTGINILHWNDQMPLPRTLTTMATIITLSLAR